MVDFSSKKVSDEVIEQIAEALEKIDYGSIEIIIQNKCVTQISTREITKTNHPVLAADINKGPR